MLIKSNSNSNRKSALKINFILYYNTTYILAMAVVEIGKSNNNNNKNIFYTSIVYYIESFCTYVLL